MTLRILSLHTYPVKSCAGLRHDEIRAGTGGLSMDRQWVLVDRYGIFMTQRQYPRMALIHPAFPEGFDGALALSAPGMPVLAVPPAQLHAAPQSAAPAKVPVRIWGADTLGADEGDAPAQWLSQFLGTRCRLLRVHPDAHRVASPGRVQAWREQYGDRAPALADEHVFAFADGYPYLVTNQASLAELNRRLAAQGAPVVDMARFRPNIVVAGLAAYEEDYLCGMRSGALSLAIVKACARCSIPNIDPVTAIPSPETGLVLAQHRQFAEGVMFGVNAVAACPVGGAVLRTGDALEPEYTV
ncbi:MOSC domain-containing protein [Pusillimonas sp. TS35]|uniref:MOSC domain-containing protein n=1 Tax=Paracandidimonas lactea TaxID=2895524 RepID=UPI0013720B5C|nr:MOSC N-terminal beta barrel domain-containing protein [Paracandidimonas lactea]MYN12553.1 MOSC domain-containing protein [Pusillimonas sp. TS35]